MTSNDELTVLILPWAKAHEEEKYRQTLAVAQNAKTFRRYLIRLIEIRWTRERDAQFIRSIPLSVLEDSGIAVRLRHGEDVLEVSGRLAPSRTWSFAELGMIAENPESLATLVALKRELDLELIETGPAVNLPPPVVFSPERDKWKVSKS